MNMKIKISIISLLIIVGCGQTIDQDSLRNTQEGLVIGMEGENNTFAWKGIPFAKPPIGELRWKAPQDASAWNGTLEAIEFKSTSSLVIFLDYFPIDLQLTAESKYLDTNNLRSHSTYPHYHLESSLNPENMRI